MLKLLIFSTLCFVGIQSIHALPSEYYGVEMKHEPLHGLHKGTTYVAKFRDHLYFLKFNGAILEYRRYATNGGLSEIKEVKTESKKHPRSLSFHFVIDDGVLRPTLWVQQLEKRRIAGGHLGHYSSLEYFSDFSLELEEIEQDQLETSIHFSNEGYRRKRRLWVSTESIPIEADYISKNDDSVRLNGTKGQSWQVPLEKLSKQDRTFIDFIEGNPSYDIRSSTSSMLDHRKIGEEW